MRIQITSGGIYGSEGEIAIGTELKVESVPAGWAGRYIDLDALGGEPAGDGTEALEARVTELEGIVADRDKLIVDLTAKLPKPSLKAEHHGGGKFNVTEGEALHLSGLSKADADAFNAMSDEDKAEFVKAEKAKA